MLVVAAEIYMISILQLGAMGRRRGVAAPAVTIQLVSGGAEKFDASVAYVNFLRNGTSKASQFGNYNGGYLEPWVSSGATATIGDSYQVRQGGGGWQAITTERSFGFSGTTFIEISAIAGGGILASATYTAV